MLANEKKSLPDVRSLWIGHRLSKIEQLCIRSFLDHGHPFVLYAYQEIEGIPDEVEVRDGNDVLPKKLSKQFVERGNIANFADWFRWELLRTAGGYWVDMDVICLAPFDFASEIVFGWQQDDDSAIGVLRFPVGHVATVDMVDRCCNPNRFREGDSSLRILRKAMRRIAGNSRANIGWEEAGGPRGFRDVVRKYGLESYGLPYTVFYPVHHTHFRSLFDDTFKNDYDLFSNTKAVHLWNEVGRKYFGWNKDATYDQDSLVEALKRKHGISEVYSKT